MGLATMQEATTAAGLRASIRETKERQRELDREYRQARRRLDQELAAQVRQLARELARKPVRNRSRSKLDPHHQAGAVAIEAMRAQFAKGPMSLSAAGDAAGVKNGTRHWAVLALEDDGVVEWTGKFVNRSKVYRMKEES